MGKATGAHFSCWPELGLGAAMEDSKASSHGLKSLLVAPAIEIQSCLCFGTCTLWKSTRERAGREGLGVQEVKYPTSLVYQLVPSRGS